MSEESTTPGLVERMRGLAEATNRRDLDQLMSFFDPDAVWEVGALGRSFEGITAIRGFLQDWLGAYEDWEQEADEVLDLGNGVGFVAWTQKGRLAGSTAVVRQRLAHVATWADGAVVKMSGFRDIDEARAAAERLAESRG